MHQLLNRASQRAVCRNLLARRVYASQYTTTTGYVAMSPLEPVSVHRLVAGALGQCHIHKMVLIVNLSIA